MTGCSLIYEQPETPSPLVDGDSEFLNLSFRLMVPVEEKSRIDDANHEEISSENPSLEDRIYSDDFCFFIFAGSKNNPDPAFITKVYNGSGTTDPHTSISGGPNEYIIKVSVARGDFDQIVPDMVSDVTFRIVAVANVNKMYNSLTPAQCSSFTKLIAAASEWDFDIFGTLYTGQNTLVAAPRIPMFGTMAFEATRDKLYKSTPATPVWGDDLCLLRSLAKVKIQDAIVNRDADGYPYVSAVTLSTLSKGYMLPYDAANYINGHQIETPRPYSEEGNTKTLALAANTGQKQWFGYIPEQMINDPNSTSTPYFSITIVNKKAGGDIEEVIFDVPMDSYNDRVFDFGDYILRNHIYTLTVTKFGDTIECEVDLAPYRLCVLEPTFGL